MFVLFENLIFFVYFWVTSVTTMKIFVNYLIFLPQDKKICVEFIRYIMWKGLEEMIGERGTSIGI